MTPNMVVDGVAERGGIEGTDVVTMAPGDEWDSEVRDSPAPKWIGTPIAARHLEDLLKVHGPKIAERTAQEEGVVAELARLRDLISRSFVRDVPRVFARRLAPKPFVFHVPSDEASRRTGGSRFALVRLAVR